MRREDIARERGTRQYSEQGKSKKNDGGGDGVCMYINGNFEAQNVQKKKKKKCVRVQQKLKQKKIMAGFGLK